ncbi:MAG: glycosyltransferase [Flavobacterium sp.]|jgi:glycosyltransferase involved in cell wall biosynthesis
MGSQPDKKIKVVFFSRKPRNLGNFSVEIYFQLIQAELSHEFEVINKVMPYESSGLFKRLANALFCMVNQGDVNHITGDIHYVAAFLKKRKTLLTILDCGMLHQTTGIKHRILKHFWFTLPIRKSKIVTAISTATKTDVLKFEPCPADKIQVIYVCISPDFKQAPQEFNAQSPRILQIGTAQNKNVHRLVPALKGIPCTLVIIGKIDQALKDLIAQNEIQLELYDRRLSDKEVQEQYQKADIVSLVSTLEGFGMPIVEANAVGRVCIAGTNSSMPEIAQEAAHLVDAYSITDIHAGIQKLIADATYREQLIQNGFQNAARFSAASLAKQYAAIYRKSLSE